MCSSGQNTTTSSSQPPPQVLNAYSNLTNAAGQLASQPLQQYSGPLVAGFTPQQQQGFQTIQNAQGMAQPFINSGAQMIGAAGQPVTAPGQMTGDQISSLYGMGTGAIGGALNAANTSPSAVSNYMSPYLRQAVGATEAVQNEQDAQQQAALKGNAMSAGAWGGDRSAVAQGILGGQQALANNATISGMENTGYQSAMQQLAQQEALQSQTGLAAGSQLFGLGNTQANMGLGAKEASGWLGENAGSQLAGLGTTSLTDALTGANANLSAGAQQQQLAQEQLNIPYQQFMQQQAYPYQQLGFLGNLVEGTGSLSGGTGTTTSPSASPLSQYGGLALAALALLKRGGRVGLASGGVPDVSVSFIPTGGNSVHGGGPPHAPGAAPSQDSGGQNKAMASGIAALGSGNSSAGNAITQAGWSVFGVPDAGANAASSAAAANADQAGLLNAADAAALDASAAPDAASLIDTIAAFGSGGATKLANGGPPQYAGANQNVQGVYQRYQSLPLEKLQEMAVMMPANSPQGAMVQKAIQQKQILGMGSAPTSLAPSSEITAPQGFASGGAGGKPGAGDPATGHAVAAPTPEQTALIDNDYQRILGRNPEGGDEQFYANALNSGFTPQDIAGFFTASPEYKSKFGNPNMTNTVTPQGNVVPQMQQSMFAPPSASQASPGGGLGNWFNPLPQYQPPGTSTAGGGLSFPAYTTPSKISLANITGSPMQFGMEAGARQDYDEAGSVDEDADPTDDPAKNQAIVADNEAAPVKRGAGMDTGPTLGNTKTAMAPQGNITPQGKGFDYRPSKPSVSMALATAGLAMAAGRSPNALQNIASGAMAGLDEYQRELALDDKPTIDTSTGTVRIYYPSEKKWIDTEMPSEQAQQRQQTDRYQQATLTNQQNTQAETKRHNQAMETTGIGEFKAGTGVDPATGKTVNGAWGTDDDGKPEFHPGMGLGTPAQHSFGMSPVKDANGNQIGVNVLDTTTGKVTFQPGLSGTPAQGAPDMTKTGDDFLGALPSNEANQVKALADGRMAFPTGMALKSPYWQQKLQEVGQYDPTFDAINYNTRAATRKWITAGKGADTATALNTAMGHASVLSDDFDKLNNFGGTATVLNAPINWAQRQAGDARQTNAQEAIQALGSEARKVFAASGGGNLTELEQWEKSFPINGSPAQQKGALQQLVSLFDSRINALGEQYSKGMGKSTDGLSLLSPEARQSYAKLTGRQPAEQTYDETGKPKNNPAPSPGPQIPPAPMDASQRAAGQIYQTPKGPLKWTGTGWMAPQ